MRTILPIEDPMQEFINRSTVRINMFDQVIIKLIVNYNTHIIFLPSTNGTCAARRKVTKLGLCSTPPPNSGYVKREEE